MAAAKPVTCYAVFTTLLYSLIQIVNTQFQPSISYIQFVVHPIQGGTIIYDGGRRDAEHGQQFSNDWKSLVGVPPNNGLENE